MNYVWRLCVRVCANDDEVKVLVCVCAVTFVCGTIRSFVVCPPLCVCAVSEGVPRVVEAHVFGGSGFLTRAHWLKPPSGPP